MTTTYTAITPFGAFQAKWRGDEDSRVHYSGSADAIAYFKDYLALNSISGVGGALIQFDTLEPADFYRFCQSEKAGISIVPTMDDLISEFEEKDCSVAPSSEDDESDSELVFNLFIEGELPETITQEDEESADGDFLARASTGEVDFLDKAVIDRLATLASKHTDPESAYFTLIMQAKTAVKNFFIAKFKEVVARYE